jgi:hypothetical protein
MVFAEKAAKVAELNAKTKLFKSDEYQHSLQATSTPSAVASYLGSSYGNN